MRRKLFSLLILYCFFFCSSVKSQEIYRTLKGEINIRTAWYNEPLLLGSKDLQMFVDYETATFTCVLDFGTIVTTNDSLTEIIQRKSGYKAYLWGTLGIPYINTSKSGTEKFDVEGRIDIFNRQSLLRGRGVLEHIAEGSQYAAALNMTFLMYFSQLTMPPPLPGLSDAFYIEIAQNIMAQEK